MEMSKQDMEAYRDIANKNYQGKISPVNKVGYWIKASVIIRLVNSIWAVVKLYFFISSLACSLFAKLSTRE